MTRPAERASRLPERPVPSRLRPLRSLFGRGRNRRLRAERPAAAPQGAPASRPAPPRRRRTWRQNLALALPLLAMATGGVIIGAGLLWAHRFVMVSPHFRLGEVRATGLRHLRHEDLQARAGIALGDNLFSMSLEDITRRLRAEPWIASVRLHRELPAALAIDVEERDAAAAVALGSLYLADRRGEVFKRATLDELAGLPVVTGVARDAYVHDREGSQALIREGLAALELWRARPQRAAIGELHVDAAAGTTLYTVESGVAIRLGHGDERTLRARLQRVDAVWEALSSAGQRPRVIHADAPLHPERVTVRLAADASPPASAPAGAAIAEPDGKN